jgi:hypothetical protein
MSLRSQLHAVSGPLQRHKCTGRTGRTGSGNWVLHDLVRMQLMVRLGLWQCPPMTADSRAAFELDQEDEQQRRAEASIRLAAVHGMFS